MKRFIEFRPNSIPLGINLIKIDMKAFLKQSQKSVCKALLFQSGTHLPDRGRKSLRTYVNKPYEEGVYTHV